MAQQWNNTPNQQWVNLPDSQWVNIINIVSQFYAKAKAYYFVAENKTMNLITAVRYRFFKSDTRP